MSLLHFLVLYRLSLSTWDWLRHSRNTEAVRVVANYRQSQTIYCTAPAEYYQACITIYCITSLFSTEQSLALQVQLYYH